MTLLKITKHQLETLKRGYTVSITLINADLSQEIYHLKLED
jgi:hypothetical protein